MSSLILEISQIRNIQPHPDPEVHSLEVLQVYGWYVISKKGQYKINQDVIYLPPDSIISEDFESKLFPPGSTIKLNNRRIKSIKLRKCLSQGMIVNPKEFSLEYVKQNVSKYEPPEESVPRQLKGPQAPKPKLNDNFRKYTDIENWKYYDRVINDGEEVCISLKMHGTSARFGNLKPTRLTLWGKIKQWFGYMGEYEFCYGSRNVQLSDGRNFEYKNEKQGVNIPNVYAYVAKKYMLNEIIPNGYGFYGEIVGKHVQKDYHYNVKDGDYEFYIYDIWDYENSKWLDCKDFKSMITYSSANLYSKTKGTLVLKTVPELYVGPYSNAIIERYRNGKDIIQEDIEREGIVCKTVIERSSPSLGRVIIKAISDKYWLGKQTDFH